MPSGTTFTPIPGLITPATLRDENGVVLLDGNGYPISAEGWTIGSSDSLTVDGQTIVPVITFIPGSASGASNTSALGGHGRNRTLGEQWELDRQQRLLAQLQVTVEAAVKAPKPERVRAVITKARKVERVFLADLADIPPLQTGHTQATVEALKRLEKQVSALQNEIEAELDDEEALGLLLF